MITHTLLALLPTAPMLVIAGLLFQRHWFWFAGLALLAMALGTAGAFLVSMTGVTVGLDESESHSARLQVERHREITELCRWFFAALTVAFAALMFAPLAFRRPLPRPVAAAAHLAYLGLYLGGLLLMVDAVKEWGAAT